MRRAKLLGHCCTQPAKKSVIQSASRVSSQAMAVSQYYYCRMAQCHILLCYSLHARFLFPRSCPLHLTLPIPSLLSSCLKPPYSILFFLLKTPHCSSFQNSLFLLFHICTFVYHFLVLTSLFLPHFVSRPP